MRGTHRPAEAPPRRPRPRGRPRARDRPQHHRGREVAAPHPVGGEPRAGPRRGQARGQALRAHGARARADARGRPAARGRGLGARVARCARGRRARADRAADQGAGGLRVLHGLPVAPVGARGAAAEAPVARGRPPRRAHGRPGGGARTRRHRRGAADDCAPGSPGPRARRAAALRGRDRLRDGAHPPARGAPGDLRARSHRARRHHVAHAARRGRVVRAPGLRQERPAARHAALPADRGDRRRGPRRHGRRRALGVDREHLPGRPGSRREALRPAAAPAAVAGRLPPRAGGDGGAHGGAARGGATARAGSDGVTSSWCRPGSSAA